MITLISSRNAELKDNEEEYSLVVYLPNYEERYPGLDLRMLNTLTTRGARYSTCQLPARLGLTAWVLGSVLQALARFASRSGLAFTLQVPQAVPSRKSSIGDKDTDSNQLIVSARYDSRVIPRVQRILMYICITYYSVYKTHISKRTRIGIEDYVYLEFYHIN